jgi:hypothetical protein
MRAKGNRISGKEGAALITTIVFVIFLAVFGLAFYRLAETDIPLFGYQKNLSSALYASEAGIGKLRWMIRESHKIAGGNPFSTTYVEANALSIANPTSGDFFPGEADKPYHKVSMIQAAGSKVRVRVLGSVDVDADGEAGLTASEDGFTFDPDDVNRRFEAYIGLPGILGENMSAAATAFYSGAVQVSLSQESKTFITSDGDSIDRFLHLSPQTTYGNWNQWRFIFSEPVITGEVELPQGIFDMNGEYTDDDYDTIPDYFQDLDLRTYGGNQVFTPSNDPTTGGSGRSIIYVNGSITIDGVGFGHVNDQGEIKNSDWEKTDLAFIANGDITLKRVDCGNVGRLVLVAKNITLQGDYTTKVNGIAIAFNDIILDGNPPDGSGCEYKILTHPDTSRPVKYTAYFLGSMVAGNHINLLRDGWTVIYDENVINGYMYSATISKPTITYERVEAEDFNTNNNWHNPDWELREWQENYIQEDIDSAQADYADGGGDGTPELMKLVHDQGLIWSYTPPDFAVSDNVYCDFIDPANIFQDSDISIGLQDWDYYPTIHFYMALDNWEKTSGSKTTLRKSYFQIWLSDAGGNKLTFNLSADANPIYPNNDWGAEPGKSHWRLVRLTPQLIDPLSNFDFTSVTHLDFYYNDILVRWYINGTDTEWIRYDKDDSTPYGKDGYYYYMKFNGTGHDKYPVQFKPPDADGRRQLQYEDPAGSGIFYDIQWNWDPSTATLEDVYFEDTLNPQKSAFDSVLKVDRIELPGKPASNNFLEYGLPHCLRLDTTNWSEL